MITGFWNRLFKRDALKPTQSETLQWQAVGRANISVDDAFRKADQDGMSVFARLSDEGGISALYIAENKASALRQEIDRLRRNKKKISHLVAELAELEKKEAA